MKKNVKEFLKAVRNKMLTLGLTVSGLGTAASTVANTGGNSPTTDDAHTENMSFDYKKNSFNVTEFKASGVYKGGIEINFAECTPHHLGWVFELATFLKENKNKFPKLAALGKTKEMRTIKNGPFQKLWKEMDSPEFRKAQADFMDKHKYAPIFEELSEVDGLNLDKRGDALRGAVMSAANQYRKDVVIKMVKAAYTEAAQGKKPKDVKTEDIISHFYDQRVKRSPSLKSRLLGVTNKKGKKIVFGEKDMALDYQHYLENTQMTLFAQNDMEKTLSIPVPDWSDGILSVAPKDSSKEVIAPLALNTSAKKNIYKKREIIERLKRSR